MKLPFDRDDDPIWCECCGKEIHDDKINILDGSYPYCDECMDEAREKDEDGDYIEDDSWDTMDAWQFLEMEAADMYGAACDWAYECARDMEFNS